MIICAKFHLDLLATLKHRYEITLVFTFAFVNFTNFFEKCLKKLCQVKVPLIICCVIRFLRV